MAKYEEETEAKAKELEILEVHACILTCVVVNRN